MTDITALKVTLTPDEIENYAQRMAHVDFHLLRDGEALIDHLGPADAMAVLDRTDEIMAENLALAKIDLETKRMIRRLMDAAGCPADTPVLPWAEFRRDAQRLTVTTYLIDAGDTAIVREPWVLDAILRWRSDVASRSPRCICCRDVFALDGAQTGAFLLATPIGMTAVSVSAICRRCWTELPDDRIEQAAMRILNRIKPGAKLADAAH